ncbi:MAG: type II toxin-antitoxin system RelB/DinJ family antitoxin [Lentilactobacillus diolivorans]|uniref:type II toxin-antitoxin system RelB/DinJ family antitoxin n=1 Tax=Lentilactobacillus diolivorans TaxID=179838 RepID=UPI0039EBA900
MKGIFIMDPKPKKQEPNQLIQIRINQTVANQAEDIFNKVGLTPAAAINAFYRKVISTGGIPFDLTPNQDDKDAYEIQQLSKNTPVERLDTNKKIEDWFNDPRHDY